MIVDIFNEMFTKLKTELSPLKIHSHYPEGDVVFPCVIVEELGNSTYETTTDTSGEKHNMVSIEVNIFTVTSEKVTMAKTIRKQVDAVLGDFYGMNRDYSGSIPSFLDNNIYRYTLRYSCVVDKDKKLYRR